jgi:gliding motility-associated-like protein
MKFSFSLLAFLFCLFGSFAQNIQVDATTYSPQQLIEDILIDSGCIENIEVTQTVGGNFDDGDKSFGYFSANGSGFPLEKGIVLSTGKLNHVPGPNTTLSDDDAPGWTGDADLEAALGISNTTNATIIEFDFVPKADNIRFRYIFASEEYQEGDPNTCIYSDAFAFLIKPIGGTYNNIALVPGTNTPVLVTTVHSGIPGACPPINETYFEGWNGPNAPINFNGQTKILTAETPVTVNQPYHIKLVIADEANYRYDSAVFLEGGSFNIAANLGPDRSFVTGNPLCDSETYILDATPQGAIPVGYTWFKDGGLISGETSAQLTVTVAGTYKVEIDYGNGCIASDEVLIEYAPLPNIVDTELYQCESDNDGIATFNLFDAEPIIIDGNPLLRVYSFHKTRFNAENDIDPIPNPDNYTNTLPNEIVYARIVSEYGCVYVAEVTLKTTQNTLTAFNLVNCSNPGTPGFADFELSQITDEIVALYGNGVAVNYYLSYDDAISETDPLSNPFTNTQAASQTIYVRISGERGCVGTAEVILTVINTPEFEGPDSYIYCRNTFPQPITIDSGLIGTLLDATFEWSTGENTASIEINEAGDYTVTVTRSKTIEGETYSCTESRTITVTASEPAEVTYEISGDIGNQTLTLIVNGLGDYVFSLDNGPFQRSPVFENIEGGVHSVKARDLNGCGDTIIEVYVLDFPDFFTPNNDGYHDFWQMKGLNPQDIQMERIDIFDRFGKLLYVLDYKSNGWDGTYNGNPLPSSDYWFKAHFKNGRTYRGHFTLKR